MTQQAQYASWGGFGDLVFKGRLTPSQFQDTRQWRLTPQELVHGYPRHQAQGESERVISIEMMFSNKFCDLTKSARALDDIAEKQTPQMLVVGSIVYGQYSIRSRKQVGTKTTPEGSITSMTYQIELVEVRE
ncbi:phage tail protein [Vibrio campbellii]|uniref:phage tail protein n=1 Tax=Vibrio campbellii TaxID=680 RepID=UPI001F2BD29B|nr:phage tail protein [Vibrio campbellii]MCE7729633.1 phage tail protein [Vibrio campbellii]